MLPIKINAKLNAYTKSNLVAVDLGGVYSDLVVNEDNLKGEGTEESPLDLVYTPDESTIIKTEEGTKITAVALLDEDYEESDGDTLPNPIKTSDIRASFKELNQGIGDTSELKDTGFINVDGSVKSDIDSLTDAVISQNEIIVSDHDEINKLTGEVANHELELADLSEKVSTLTFFNREYNFEIKNEEDSLIHSKISILRRTEETLDVNTEEEVYNALYDLTSSQGSKLPVTGYLSYDNSMYSTDYIYEDSGNVILTDIASTYVLTMSADSLQLAVDDTTSSLTADSFTLSCFSYDIK